MIISKSPVRISFFGGGTDYPDYFKRNNGAVLGCAIDKHVYVSVNRLSDFFEYKIRVGYSKSELVNSVDDIIHPSVKACLRHKEINYNLDIHIFADLPARTGLGSSSAFTVGFLNALYALNGQHISKYDLAKEVIHIEQDLIKENVGSQDQIHAAYGGFNIIEFTSSGFRVHPVVISTEKRKRLENSMMVFFTGITRFASDVVEEQIHNTKQGNKDDYLEKMRGMVFSAEKIISDSRPDEMLPELGSLLHESWQLKKCLSSKISNTTIDDIYLKAMQAGAYGGKICGAGGGGFLVLFVDPKKQDDVRRVLPHLLEVKCGLEDQGSSIIYYKT